MFALDIDGVLADTFTMFVTSRPKSAYESTYNWLAVWGFPDVPLVFTDLRAKHHCLFPGDTPVDDNPKTVRQCLEAGRQALLSLTHHNQTEASNLPTTSSLEQLLLYTAPTATQPQQTLTCQGGDP